jgi:phosphoribosylaminoimidazole (AIR) synthetase
MTAQRERKIFFVDARTVITNAQQFNAALLDIYLEPSRPCVEAVLEQFLHHRSGTLYHLTGGNLVSESLA